MTVVTIYILLTIVSQNLLHPFFFLSVWKWLQEEASSVTQSAIPLLLHCLLLPAGADTFWNIVEKDFSDDNWRIRFAAGNFGWLTLKTFQMYDRFCGMVDKFIYSMPSGKRILSIVELNPS